MYHQVIIFPSLKFYGNALRLPWLLVTCDLIMQLYIFKQNIVVSRCNLLCQHWGLRQNILRISLCAALISHLARFYFWMYQTLSFFYNWKDTTANISQVLSESETVFNCYEFLVLCNLFGCCTDSQSTSRRKIKR